MNTSTQLGLSSLASGALFLASRRRLGDAKALQASVTLGLALGVGVALMGKRG